MNTPSAKMCLHKLLSLLLVLVCVVLHKYLAHGCESYSIELELLKEENPISQCLAYGFPAIKRKVSEKLRKIVSTNQSISVLHEKVLLNLLHVEKVVLSSNQIITIKQAAFKNLPLLKYVYLNDNQITMMEDGIFVGVPKLLQLHLQNNRLWYFEQQWFGQIPTLEWLNLEYNSIKTITIRSFTNLPNLVYLNLGHNQIMHIDETGLEGLHRLEILDLSYNRMYHLPDYIFASSSELRVLNLYNNHLTYISDQVLATLTELHELVVLFNPWQCGCYNKIFTWAKNESVGIQNNYLKCIKTNNLAFIPTCVTTSNNLTECVRYKMEDFCDVLYSQQDFECYFDYDKYINI